MLSLEQRILQSTRLSNSYLLTSSVGKIFICCIHVFGYIIRYRVIINILSYPILYNKMIVPGG